MKSWTITLDNFSAGAGPASHLDATSTLGGAGHYSTATSVDILSYPKSITQGPALADLTNGTDAGVVDQLINYILETPTSADVTFGIGSTKLFKIGSSTVASGGTPSWPVAITSAVAGKSIIYLKGVLYYFFTRAADGAIGSYDLTTTFDHSWQTGLAKADVYPVAKKEDVMLFGHGQYVGTYFSSTATISKTKLNFGDNTEVIDICFHSNQWWIAVNSGVSGSNRNSSQIYTYAGGATTSILSDEAAVGLQKIGFIFPDNGVIYVAYQDSTFTGGYKIGYLSGKRIEPLLNFTGSLPTHAQKTLYKNTILFLSSGKIYAGGSVIGDMPFALSNLADGGYATCGALAAPFGTPMVSSTESASYKLAKFSGNTVTASWNSILFNTRQGKNLGMMDEIIVETNILGANARCDLTLYYNQSASNSGAQQITGTGTSRHTFKVSKSNISDIKVKLDWAEGNATNLATIKSVELNGHSVLR